MCGIFFSMNNNDMSNKDIYRDALALMDHRGPDYKDIFFGRSYIIGHTRLAIIDTSSKANQPFWDTNKRYLITFNGEIYNYRELQRRLMDVGCSLRTNSDTEVLLELIIHFGIEATLKSVRGMFAFVFYDTLTKRMFAVRDHFGQKPLYYYEDGGMITVASSIRPLLHLKKNIQPNISAYFTYLCTRGIIHPEDTFFSDIKCLPAGHMLIYDGKTCERKEYFSVWNLYNGYGNSSFNNKIKIDDAIDEFDMLIKQAVHRHLVSDVPVGILLSGGIDSTILYWYAYDTNGCLTAFTKVSPGIENIPMDIVPQILKRKMSKCLFNLEQVELYLPVLVDFIKMSHSPSRWGGGPPMYRLCKEARKLGIYVLLGGDCVDEYFAGYKEYEETFNQFDGNLFQLSKCILIQRNSPFYTKRYCERYESYQTQTRRRILDCLEDIDDLYERFFHATLLHDTSVFLQSCTLLHSDAYSMMASVELRNPMLDIDLVRFICNLPSYLRYAKHTSGSNNKYLLRELASRKIGNFVNVPKEGTRNYSMKISDHSFWDFDRFILNEIIEVPFDPLKVKPNKELLFKFINLEIFHRLYFLGEKYPVNDILTESGKRACLP